MAGCTNMSMRCMTWCPKKKAAVLKPTVIQLANSMETFKLSVESVDSQLKPALQGSGSFQMHGTASKATVQFRYKKLVVFLQNAGMEEGQTGERCSDTKVQEFLHQGTPAADSRQKMRRSLPKTCREATVEMAASVSIVFTAFPRTSSSSQLVPCTAPAHGILLLTCLYERILRTRQWHFLTKSWQERTIH